MMKVLLVEWAECNHTHQVFQLTWRRKQQSIRYFALSTCTESHTAIIDCSSARLLRTAQNPAADTRKRRWGWLGSGLQPREEEEEEGTFCCRPVLHGTSAQKQESKLSRSRHFGNEIILDKMKPLRKKNHPCSKRKQCLGWPHFHIFLFLIFWSMLE